MMANVARTRAHEKAEAAFRETRAKRDELRNPPRDVVSYWVHVDERGRETYHREPPPGLPVLYVMKHRADEWTFTFKRDGHAVRPPGKGWEWDVCLIGSDRWKRTVRKITTPA
jgi:hypothetical protein